MYKDHAPLSVMLESVDAKNCDEGLRNTNNTSLYIAQSASSPGERYWNPLTAEIQMCFDLSYFQSDSVDLHDYVRCWSRPS